MCHLQMLMWTNTVGDIRQFDLDVIYWKSNKYWSRSDLSESAKNLFVTTSITTDIVSFNYKGEM